MTLTGISFDGAVKRCQVSDQAARAPSVASSRQAYAMTITIGSSTFDNVVYDTDVDVLYLHVGDPSTAVDFDESPEGPRCVSTLMGGWSV